MSDAANPAANDPGITRGALPGRDLSIAYAVLAVGLLLWTDGPLRAWYTILLTAVAVAVLALHHVRPGLLEGRPIVSDPGDRLEAVALLLFAIGVLRAGFFFGFLVYAAGWVLFLRALGTGRPAHVTPKTAWRSGWVVRMLAIGVFAALLILADEFAGEFNSSSSYTSGGYRYTTTSHFDANSGYDTGQAPWLALLLLPAGLWLVWDRVREHPRGRYVPLASVGAAAAYGLWVLIDDYRFVQELYDIGGTYARFQASGPTWFVIACLPSLVAGGLIAFKGAGTAKGSEGLDGG